MNLLDLNFFFGMGSFIFVLYNLDLTDDPKSHDYLKDRKAWIDLAAGTTGIAIAFLSFKIFNELKLT